MFDELTVLYGRAGTRFTALATSAVKDDAGQPGGDAQAALGGASNAQTDESRSSRGIQGRPIARVPSWVSLDVSTPKASQSSPIVASTPAPVPPDFGLLRRPPVPSGRLRTLTEEDAEAGFGIVGSSEGLAGRFWYLEVDWSRFDASSRVDSDSYGGSWLSPAGCCSAICHPAWTKL